MIRNLYCNGSHGISVGSLGQVCFIGARLRSIIGLVLVCWRNRHRCQHLCKKYFHEQRSERCPNQSLWRFSGPELDIRRRYWICSGQLASSSPCMSYSLCFQNVTFEDFYVNNVDNPIYLDQVRHPRTPGCTWPMHSLSATIRQPPFVRNTPVH